MKFNKDGRLMSFSTYGDKPLTAEDINKLIELEKASIEYAKIPRNPVNSGLKDCFGHRWFWFLIKWLDRPAD